jgi:hypothetical protein
MPTRPQRHRLFLLGLERRRVPDHSPTTATSSHAASSTPIPRDERGALLVLVSLPTWLRLLELGLRPVDHPDPVASPQVRRQINTATCGGHDRRRSPSVVRVPGVPSRGSGVSTQPTDWDHQSAVAPSPGTPDRVHSHRTASGRTPALRTRSRRQRLDGVERRLTAFLALGSDGSGGPWRGAPYLPAQDLSA